MKLRKIIALLLCAMTVMSLFAGCGNDDTPATNDTPANNNTPSTNTPATNDTPAATTYKEEIIIGLAQEFTGIDPQGSSATVNQLVQDNVFDLLTDSDLTVMENRGELCETITMVEPDLWEFKLHENVNFHDGTILNVDDVIFTFERAKDSSYCASYMEQIEELIKIDDYKFQLKLTAPNLDFNYTLANNTLAIMSKEAFETMPAEEAATIGTGPWKFEEYVAGEYVSLVRFEEGTFWDIPNTKKLTFKFLPEASARLIALQTGEIDVCLDPSAIDFATITEDPDLELIQAASRGLRYIAFNCEGTSPFADPLVRKAVASAVKRADIIEVAKGGYAEPATNVMSKGVWSYKEIDGIPEDIAKAKEYLTQAGYPDGFSTTLVYQADTERSDIATVLQAQLAEIGITVELQGVESAAFSQIVKTDVSHEFCIGRWTPGMNADGMFRNTLYSTAANNFANNHDAKTDDLLDRAMAETDTAKREALYQELQVYLTEELIPWVPLYQIMSSVAVKAEVEGLMMHPADLHQVKYIQIPLG